MCGQYTLELQSPEIQHLCKKDKRLARVISAIGPLTYSLHQDAYSFLIREIIEQLMSVKAASVIYGRLVDLCSGNVTPDTISSLPTISYALPVLQKQKLSTLEMLHEQ